MKSTSSTFFSSFTSTGSSFFSAFTSGSFFSTFSLSSSSRMRRHFTWYTGPFATGRTASTKNSPLRTSSSTSFTSSFSPHTPHVGKSTSYSTYCVSSFASSTSSATSFCSHSRWGLYHPRYTFCFWNSSLFAWCSRMCAEYYPSLLPPSPTSSVFLNSTPHWSQWCFARVRIAPK